MIKRSLLSITLLGCLLLSGRTIAQDTTFTITADGKVGIGLTVPQALLHVHGDLLVDSYQGNFYIQYVSKKTGWYWGTANGGKTLLLGQVLPSGEEPPIFNLDPKGLFLETNLEVDGNLAVSGLVDSVDVSELKKQVEARRSRFKSFLGLNEASVDVGNTWTKLKTNDNLHVFTKQHDETKIEVFVNSRFAVGTLSDLGIYFQVRLNGQEPTWETQGSILQASSEEFLSFMGVFEGLPAGDYNVEIWARVTGTGNATDVLVDPLGFRGGVVVKETW